MAEEEADSMNDRHVGAPSKISTLHGCGGALLRSF